MATVDASDDHRSQTSFTHVSFLSYLSIEVPSAQLRNTLLALPKLAGKKAAARSKLSSASGSSRNSALLAVFPVRGSFHSIITEGTSLQSCSSPLLRKSTLFKPLKW